jgi:threonyl-tRNA synthetase
MSTVQLDFNLPRRFGLEYVGADNARHRPLMIHRALFGSVERFMAVLIEHYAGALPTWLSPEQVRVLPVSEAHAAYAQSVGAACSGAGLRVSVDDAEENLGARIRKAKLTKVPYILVVGADDVTHQTVGVNARSSTDKPRRGVDLTTFVDDTVAEVQRRGSPEDGASETPTP